ncbi:MAG: hypothetical protein ACREPH_06500 [Rhodanobacteraceae bacterium]
MNKMSDTTFNGLPGDGEVEAGARAIFRNACEGTDSYHALRLGLARRKALVAGTRNHAFKVWAPVAGAAACCMLVAGMVWMRPVNRASPVATSVATSAPIVVGQNDEDENLPEVGSTQMEVVQNLDFYRWLATQPSVASASGGSEH